MAIVRTSYDTRDAGPDLEMDTNGTYEIGTNPSDQVFYPERVLVVAVEAASVSTGTFSVGTNHPAYDNILGATAWSLLGAPAGSARMHDLLSAGGPTPPSPVTGVVKVRVNKGLLDAGGTARICVEGILHADPFSA